MKALKNRLNFVSLSLIIGTVISVSGLVPLIPQEMYITRLALLSFAKNLLSFIVLAYFFKQPLKLKKQTKQKISLSALVLFTVFAFTLCFSCNIVPNLISYATGIDIGSSYVFNLLDYIAMALIPAIIEETAFRGFILGGFCEYGAKFAVIISAVIFAMSHTSLTAVIYSFLCGIILGCLYLRTDSLVACMTVHFLCNALTITCGLFQGLYNIAIGICIFLLVIIFVAIKLKRKPIFPQEQQKSDILSFKTALTNPMIIILFAIEIINIIMMYF